MTTKHLRPSSPGFVPATQIVRHGRAKIIGVAGTSPAMTIFNQRSADPLRRIP
jgi:hypothetical protein